MSPFPFPSPQTRVHPRRRGRPNRIPYSTPKDRALRKGVRRIFRHAVEPKTTSDAHDGGSDRSAAVTAPPRTPIVEAGAICCGYSHARAARERLFKPRYGRSQCPVCHQQWSFAFLSTTGLTTSIAWQSFQMRKRLSQEGSVPKNLMQRAARLPTLKSSHVRIVSGAPFAYKTTNIPVRVLFACDDSLQNVLIADNPDGLVVDFDGVDD